MTSRRRLSAFAASTLALAGMLAVSPRANAQVLPYWGGRVISNVEIVEISWTGNVSQNYLQQLSGFYTAIVNSPFMDWMSEYDTINRKGVDGQPGSNQHIGRGTFVGIFTIQPGNGSTLLNTQQVAAELSAQITSGKLPMPSTDAAGNVNTLYMIDFPAGYDIDLFGYHACQQYGAFHFTMMFNGKSVPYGVHPDCGYQFQEATIVHSHELAEAISDMEVGLADPNGPAQRPMAWQSNNGEDGDLCQGTQGQVAGYTVQGIWSNFANGCVVQIPVCDGTTQPPNCRQCKSPDGGCTGAKPACATSGPLTGQCVQCTGTEPEACQGATPTCNDSTNTCVGCLMNADCKTATAPVCDVASTTCRGCKSDSECAMGKCDTQNDAQAGSCVACNVDTDCAADQGCQGHMCVQMNPVSGSGPSSGTFGAGSGAGAGSGGADPGEDPADATGVTGGCGCRTAVGDDVTNRSLLALGAFGLALAAARRRRRS